jgi:hypothetical protein
MFLPASESEMILDCRTSERALVSLPDRELSLRIMDGTFAVLNPDFMALARRRIVSRSADRLVLRAETEGVSASFEAELVRVNEVWGINWRVAEATGQQGELTLQAEGAGTCVTSGASA